MSDRESVAVSAEGAVVGAWGAGGAGGPWGSGIAAATLATGGAEEAFGVVVVGLF